MAEAAMKQLADLAAMPEVAAILGSEGSSELRSGQLSTLVTIGTAISMAASSHLLEEVLPGVDIRGLVQRAIDTLARRAQSEDSARVDQAKGLRDDLGASWRAVQ